MRLADPQRRVRGEQLVLADDAAAGSRPAPAGRRSRSSSAGTRAGRRAGRWSTTAIGMSRTVAARRRSLTTRTSLWSQRSTSVPAIGLNRRFGSVAATNTSATASGESVDDEHDRGEGDLVDPVAEQRDELAGPQRRERAVEREPDVRVPPDARRAISGRRARDRRSSARRRVAGRAGPAPGAGATDGQAVTPGAAGRCQTAALEADVLGRRERRSRLEAGRPVPAAAAAPSRPTPRSRRSTRASSLLARARRDADDAREQEEREAERQEHVAERGDVLDDRDRDRDDVAEDQRP